MSLSAVYSWYGTAVCMFYKQLCSLQGKAETISPTWSGVCRRFTKTSFISFDPWGFINKHSSSAQLRSISARDIKRGAHILIMVDQH